jgi:hypothetical protein
MLQSIVEELRELLELEVRPPAAGVKPGFKSASTASPATGIGRTMQRGILKSPAQRRAEQQQKQILARAKQTAQRQARAAAQTKGLMKKTNTAAPAAGSPT